MYKKRSLKASATAQPESKRPTGCEKLDGLSKDKAAISTLDYEAKLEG